MDRVVLLLIILIYFAVLLGIAFYTSRNSDNESFFIGNRNSKWWLVAFGMIGTSLSGMTFISVPGTVGKGGFGYFQVVIGYWLGYFAVAYVLLPLYYRLQLTSIYTYLQQRLGQNAYKTGALFFILSRTLGATIRLYLVIKVLEQFVLADMGIPFEASAIIILGLILLYTYRGGVKTIVWTDTLQTTFMLLALVICVGYIMHSLHLDLGSTWAAMSQKGYTHMLQTDIKSPGFFLKQVLGGAFITIAMTGLDQEMMQKNISVSNLKDSQKNMIVFCFVLLAANLIFLLLGGLLHLYAGANGITAAGDDLFPAVAVNSGLPFFITVCFMVGLISAVFPSADGALTALTSSFCIDMLGIKRNPTLTEAQQKKTRLLVHNIFALVFLGCVFFFRAIDNGSLIDILLKMAGFTYGPLLGLFAFGILTKRNVPQHLPIWLCLISLVATFGIDLVNNAPWYTDKLHLGEAMGNALNTLSNNIFHGYKIGVELLIVNAAITFLLLSVFAVKDQQKPQNT
ncbi:sodium:solute symporter [Nemorincola caseinilytica]|uniref:Sodium:solute symporter n=1 Tax=Nemorincola caseinilytica TaxID=2054315 RepID=A0ABP8NFE2_9BACT